MTGFMLHNVEGRHRLSRGLEASMEADDDASDTGGEEGAAPALPALPLPPPDEALAAASPEVAAYASALAARLAATEAALSAATRAAASAAARAALSPPAPSGNALLAYLRALQESQVAALSGAGSPELHSAVAALVGSLLGKLPPTRLRGAQLPAPGGGAHPPPLPGLDASAAGGQWHAERPEFSLSISVSRDYASALLLWALGAGHYAGVCEQRAFLERRLLGGGGGGGGGGHDGDASLTPFLDGSGA
jgi:hypothetical protein